MKRYFPHILSALLLSATGCKKDSDFLNVKPTSILTPEQAFSSPAQALSVLADLYNRQVDFSSLDGGWVSFADVSESLPAENGQAEIVGRNSWDVGAWCTWADRHIRHLNLFIERATAAPALPEPDKKRFLAEARFLRANYYFEMVKRMGGVPLILESLEYDFNGDPTYLQYPRSKESEIYDFVISEAEAIKN